MKNTIIEQLQEANKVLNDFISNDANIQKIEEASQLLVHSFKNGGKVLSCGNGGSMADAIHFAEELTGRFRDSREPLPAIAISDAGYLSCVSNDYGYEHVFSRFLKGVGNQGDVLLGISTSGNSKNVIKAFEVAKEKGIKTIALTGKDGGDLGALADVEICVPHFGYADRVQEVHIKIIHILILLIEKGV